MPWAHGPVSILMPVCNEADVIEDVLDEWIHEVLDKLPPGSEMVLDDCSNDGTEKILADIARRHPQVRVEFNPRDGFFNSAMRLYRLAKCPLVFFTDSDGQYVPAEFWKVAESIDANDMVHGAKIARKDPLYRVAASAAYNGLVRLMFRSKCEDVNSAFRLIRRPLLDAVLGQVHCLRMLPNSEMYIRAEAMGFRIRNVPVSHRARKFGKSRSLPWRRFVMECFRAFRGILELRRELSSLKRTRGPAEAAGNIGLRGDARRP